MKGKPGMTKNKFFVCPNCGNVKKFKIFMSNFQVVEQSPELGVSINKGGILPNLRQNDNYVECQICFKKSDYDMALDNGKKYVQDTQKTSKIKLAI